MFLQRIVYPCVAIAAVAASDTTCQVSRESLLLQTGSVAGTNTAALAPLENTSSDSVPTLEMLEALSEVQAGASESEKRLYYLVKSLRERGYTCTDGSSYAPNSAPFLWNDELWRAGKFWAQEMAQKNFFAHRRDGSTAQKRCARFGFQPDRSCGENLAAGSATPEGALDSWKNSVGHCNGMMNRDFNRFGVGYAYSSGSTYRHYWAASFGEQCAGSCCDKPGDPCDYYRDNNLCHVDNVKKACAKTCGLCGAPATSCADQNGHPCQYYRDNNFCHTENVKKACPKTCGFCR